MNTRLTLCFYLTVATTCGCLQSHKNAKSTDKLHQEAQDKNIAWLQEATQYGERESAKEEGASFQEMEYFTLVSLPLERLNNHEGSTAQLVNLVTRDFGFANADPISFWKPTEKEVSNAFKRVLQDQRFSLANTTPEVLGKKLIVQVIGIRNQKMKGIVFNFARRDWEYNHRGIYRRPTLHMDTKWPVAFTVLVSEGANVRWYP